LNTLAPRYGGRAATYCGSREGERRCREIRQRAERKVGQGLKEMAEAGERQGSGGDRRSSSPDTRMKLGDYGISWDQSSDWQRVASLSEDEFETALAQDASTSNMVEMAKVQERGGPVEPPATPVGQDALWLWGELDRMERKHWYDQEPFDFVETMTPMMRDDVFRLAPRAARFFSRFVEERKP
jgi:hypothetical protein